jgi:uncharacterized membrane protein
MEANSLVTSLRRRKSMKTCKSIACLFGFMLALIAVATAADQPALTFKFKTFNVPGATATNPGGINNTGVLVGQYTDSGGVGHGFILKGKKLTTLDDPKGTSGTTGASNLALNGPIAVVGTYISATTGGSVGFLYKNGKFTDIPGPKGALGSTANAINDHGDITGAYFDSAAVQHGYIKKGNKYKTVDPPGSTAPSGNGINNKGQVVLEWLDSSSVYQSVLYNGKTYKKIDVPGAGGSSFVTDINTGGDVTYQWIDSGTVNHGALLHKGKYYKFDYPHSAFTFAGAVNDHNTIVGGYRTSSVGNLIGFTATFK